MRLNGHKSGKFPVMRGILQASVLSPILFLMVMDPLLQQLEKSALGPSINNLYVGGFLHADDIRTLASSLDVLDTQVSLVQRLAKENFLKLNTRKCEVVVFASDPHAPYPECKIAEQANSVGSEDKCLGYLWQGNLMANRAVEEGIKKARRGFFHYGAIGVFQGDFPFFSFANLCPLVLLWRAA